MEQEQKLRDQDKIGFEVTIMGPGWDGQMWDWYQDRNLKDSSGSGMGPVTTYWAYAKH